MEMLDLMLSSDKDNRRLERATLFIALFITIAGCSHKQISTESITQTKPELTRTEAETWILMVGRWYGDQPTKAGGRRQWLVERNKDGTYKINFRFTEQDGTIRNSAEVGEWAISGPVYFSSFRGWVRGNTIELADRSDPYNYDAYRIIQLSNELFEYEHLSTGNRFTIKRVPSDFEMPE